MPEDISESLADARSKLEAVRNALRKSGDDGQAALAGRLERLAAEVTRIERVVADAAVAAGDGVS